MSLLFARTFLSPIRCPSDRGLSFSVCSFTFRRINCFLAASAVCASKSASPNVQGAAVLAPSSTFPKALAQTPPATFGLSVPASSDVCRTPCRRGAAAAVRTVAPSLSPGPDCGTYGFDTILTAAELPSLETLRASSNTFLCPPRRLIRTR